MVQGSEVRPAGRSDQARASARADHAESLKAGRSVAAYLPRTVDAVVWGEVGPVARRWAAMVPGSELQVVRRLKPLSQYLAWRVAGGRSFTDPAVVFRADEIEQFTSSGCGHLAGGTRGTYRSALRTIGEHVVGVEVACPDRTAELAKPAPLTPYSEVEFAALLGAISGRPTAFQRDNAKVLVAFGRGAGLTAGDIAELTGSDVHPTRDGATIVEVAGDRPRQVPVLGRWEKLAAQMAAAAGDGPVFNRARARATRNDIARFCDRLGWRDAPRLSVTRLRIGWIVEHLAAGVPLHVLADAAGVTAPNLARYAQFLTPPSHTDATALLRQNAGAR